MSGLISKVHAKGAERDEQRIQNWMNFCSAFLCENLCVLCVKAEKFAQENKIFMESRTDYRR